MDAIITSPDEMDLNNYQENVYAACTPSLENKENSTIINIFTILSKVVGATIVQQ